MGERLRHRLTAHHLRDRLSRSKASRIAICSCGWRDPLFRPGLEQRLRRLACLVLGGHRWGEPETAGFGPVGYDAEDPAAPDPEMEWQMRQCERCWECETT